jgi:hypothetical protein
MKIEEKVTELRFKYMDHSYAMQIREGIVNNIRAQEIIEKAVMHGVYSALIKYHGDSHDTWRTLSRVMMALKSSHEPAIRDLVGKLQQEGII